VHRKPLLAKLRTYEAGDPDEEQSRRRIIEFVRSTPNCFDRTHLPGHITGAAWVVDHSNTHALLTLHRKLGLWLQLGGHADGDPDVLRVALREAQEESGLPAIVPITEDLFDVDVHPIPARGNVPAHLHYDIRFLLQVQGNHRLSVSDESIDLAWVPRSGIPGLVTDESVVRMHRKWVRRPVSAVGPARS
jgi:8-oxo-dGTP pyrophosphatase MutT (NUDIX family)